MFDPEFNDARWNDEWLAVPIAPIPSGEHPDGFRVERQPLEVAEIFGRHYRMEPPFDCRLLYDGDGLLWMSDTPQERMMMYNNAQRTRGHVLIGGLGLGLYPQYAAAAGATGFTVIEESPAVQAITGPVLESVLDVPLMVYTGDVSVELAGPVTQRYDTIFLDIWETLDPVHLPWINRLRNHALRHLVPGGEVLLWGYFWMVSLFVDACHQLLAVKPGQRAAWLAEGAASSPHAVALLTPVVQHFDDVDDMEEALEWCRRHIVNLALPD
ncbi:MAG: hypothetical protein GYB65_16020 [Chloroflexi bacterium]|nr:hypothetical protein [Chloroflexota bacterium]